MTSAEIVQKIKHLQGWTEEYTRRPENTGEQQMAYCTANSYMMDALGAAEFNANHFDGWAKWTRVAIRISHAAEKIDEIGNFLLAGWLHSLASEISPAVDPDWGDKADRNMMEYPHQN